MTTPSNGLFNKIVSGVLTAGMVSLFTLSYNITSEIAVIETEIQYIKDTLDKIDKRLSTAETSFVTVREQHQNQQIIDLKLLALSEKLEKLK